MSNARGGWEEDLATGILGVALLGLIALAALVGTFLIVVLTEIARVYQARAFSARRSRPILWIALAFLLAVWVLCAVLARQPETLPISVYLSTWSFLVYVVVVEGCDWYEQRFDPPAEQMPPEVTIDQLVAPWQEMPAVTGPTAAPVGHANSNGPRPSVPV